MLRLISLSVFKRVSTVVLLIIAKTSSMYKFAIAGYKGDPIISVPSFVHTETKLQLSSNEK
jgi:hypothetical protein